MPAGAILSLWPERDYIEEKPADPVTFEAYPDANGQANVMLYEDDGLSPAYLRGVFRRTAVSSARTASGAVIKVGSPEKIGVRELFHAF